MKTFEYSSSKLVPYKNIEVIKRVRIIKREEICQHHNPDFRIQVVGDEDVEFIWVTDMFYRINKAFEDNKKLVLILPNPAQCYRKLAYLINKFKINCKKIYTFNMGEYSYENGNVAPESYRQSFMRLFKKYFYSNIDQNLRPDEDQIQGPTTENIKYYSKMIEGLGGADVCYSGPD